jgi:hypothetical protein
MNKEQLKEQAQIEIEKFTINLQGATAKESILGYNLVQSHKIKEVDKILDEFKIEMIIKREKGHK